MSALGQKQTSQHLQPMSALPPKADMDRFAIFSGRMSSLPEMPGPWRVGYTKDMLIGELQHEFNDELPGIDFNFSQYIQDNVEEALSGVKGANSVKIIGRDLPTIERIASDVMRQMQQVRGIVDLGIFHVLGQPNLNVKVDREKAARYGLNTGDVNTLISVGWHERDHFVGG
jgi:Cu/Ag efflux pump CusA